MATKIQEIIPKKLIMNPQVAPRCFQPGNMAALQCRVHPSVILNILDAYVRRDLEQELVIGTLLGSVQAGNIVDVTDCFVDRHSLTNEGLLQIIKDHHELLFSLKQQVNSKDQVVGWFCTGSQMTELTCAVHGWFKQVSSVSKFVATPPLSEPLHLMVDTNFSNPNGLIIKSYVQVPMNIAKDACFQFHEIPLEMSSMNCDFVSIGTALRCSMASSTEERISGFEAGLENLLELLNSSISYVDRVLANEERPDAEVGRQLSQALAVDLAMPRNELETACKEVLQDHLMVAYLAILARIQFALASKLNTAFF